MAFPVIINYQELRSMIDEQLKNGELSLRTQPNGTVVGSYINALTRPSTFDGEHAREVRGVRSMT